MRPYTPVDRSAWDEFVSASKNGTFQFMRDYMDYHANRFVDFSTIVLDSRGRTVALFPANRIDSCVISHGGLSYGGMLSNSSMTTSRSLDVFAAWIAFCHGGGAGQIVYKAVPSIYHRGPADEDKYALFHFGAELYRREVLSVVDLDCPTTPQERRLRGRAKAEKSGLRVEESSRASQLLAYPLRNSFQPPWGASRAFA